MNVLTANLTASSITSSLAICLSMLLTPFLVVFRDLPDPLLILAPGKWLFRSTPRASPGVLVKSPVGGLNGSSMAPLSFARIFLHLVSSWTLCINFRVSRGVSILGSSMYLWSDNEDSSDTPQHQTNLWNLFTKISYNLKFLNVFYIFLISEVNLWTILGYISYFFKILIFPGYPRNLRPILFIINFCEKILIFFWIFLWFFKFWKSFTKITENFYEIPLKFSGYSSHFFLEPLGSLLFSQFTAIFL